MRVMMRRISGKKMLFALIYFVGLYVFTECLSWTFYSVKEGTFFSFADHQRYRLAIIQNTPDLAPPHGALPVPSIHAEVIHPYLGFVVNPHEEEGYSEYGFPNPAPTFHHPAENVLILGIVGGSFAVHTALFGTDEILARLRQIPELTEKEIIVQTLALGGYKQPQQFLALSYFLSLGAHFDMLVNLDGFNEVALAPAENAGVIYPFYPRGWAGRTSNLVDPVKLKLLGRMTTLDDRMTQWARTFSGSLLRYTITANVIWYYRHLQLYRRRQELSRRLEEHTASRAQELSYMMTGPSFNYDTGERLFQELATVWKNASLQMHHLCQTNMIAYFHFLQPNQYVPGTKVLSRKELEVAFQEDHPYRRGVLHGYPALRRAGDELQQAGVNFYDLTTIFLDETDSVYSDNCCHLTVEGYQTIGSAIGATIQSYLEAHRDILEAVGNL